MASGLARIPDDRRRQRHQLRRRSDRSRSAAGRTRPRARGCTPNIHLTCVSQDRRELAQDACDDMHALDIEQRLRADRRLPERRRPAAGVRPRLCPARPPDRRATAPSGNAFHIAVAVSPFKYTEADCVYQYVKLEKKIAAGADVAITQVGWDARKFAELQALSRRARAADRPCSATSTSSVRRPRSGWRPADLRAAGSRPNSSPRYRAESQAADGGRQARLERAARTVASPALASATPGRTSAALTTRRRSPGSSSGRRAGARLGVAGRRAPLRRRRRVLPRARHAGRRAARRRDPIPASARLASVARSRSTATRRCAARWRACSPGSTAIGPRRPCSSAWSWRSRSPSSDVRPAGTACSATSSTCVRRPVQSSYATDPAEERSGDAARWSRKCPASGWRSTSAPRRPAGSTA